MYIRYVKFKILLRPKYLYKQFCVPQKKYHFYYYLIRTIKYFYILDLRPHKNKSQDHVLDIFAVHYIYWVYKHNKVILKTHSHLVPIISLHCSWLVVWGHFFVQQQDVHRYYRSQRIRCLSCYSHRNRQNVPDFCSSIV